MLISIKGESVEAKQVDRDRAKKYRLSALRKTVYPPKDGLTFRILTSYRGESIGAAVMSRLMNQDVMSVSCDRVVLTVLSYAVFHF